jgi:hypothetical protein
MRQTIRRAIVTMLLVVTTGISAAVADDGDVAGKVARVQGRVVAVQDAQLRVLMAGDAVLVGDVLSTGKEARLEISMIDEGIFTLGERTVFVVIDYTFGGAANNAVLGLLSGALSAASGGIAGLDTMAFKLETPTATIGIRGTRLWVGTMPDGVFHVGLWRDGPVIVENRAGRVEISEPLFGTHVDDPDIAPTPPKLWPTPMNVNAKRMVAFD